MTGTGEDFQYGQADAGPHALTSVQKPGDQFKPPPDSTAYTCFNKIECILDTIEGNKALKLELLYGSDDQRIKSVLKKDGDTIRTKFFFGDYEEITENDTTKSYYYFDSPTGLCGILVKQQGSQNDKLWYTYSDHLGSVVYMVNADNTNEFLDYSFDAWGNSRKADDWTLPSEVPLFAQRGFTGHEHLSEFGLINMNGRVYDPLLGRFLSPDQFVQDPSNSQNFNRYSYCLNNPLKYTDPSGEFIFTILSAIFCPALIVPAMQLDFAWMSGGMESKANGGTFMEGALKGGASGLINAGLSFLNIPGILPNGLLHAGTNLLGNGISNTLFDKPFFDNWGYSAGSGFAGGALSGYNLAQDRGLNPWTGGLNQDQRAIWLNYKNGNITLQDAVSQMNGDYYTNAGSPTITSGPGVSRATTHGLDPNGNRIPSYLEASRDYLSVKSEIQFHPAGLSSGRRFLFTSYHELMHATMYYNGDMHNYYNTLQMNYGKGSFATSLNKNAYSQAGLKIFAERWAYGAQWARYGINGNRINYVDRMWRSLITNPVTADEYRILMLSF
jgi:RHS repeat-associated protein